MEGSESHGAANSVTAGDGSLERGITAVSEGCTGCGACVKQCGFLQQHGTPRAIVSDYQADSSSRAEMPFECSLCGLCSAVCPEAVEPDALFLAMRGAAVRNGSGSFPEHQVLRDYERRGTSRRYSYYALPPGCDTVWFPGCALAGTRANRVMDIHRHLRADIPSLGIVLDCCTKPSHDLGRDEYFDAMFGEMRDYLVGQGVRRVLVACPNCHKVFQRYGGALETRTVYEVLDEVGGPETGTVDGEVTVHDPCMARFQGDVQLRIRTLIGGIGLGVSEMKNSGRRTLCCGEGGAVACLSPDLAGRWGTRRRRQAQGRPMVTYCAGCAHQLSGKAPTSHVLDLLFEPTAALTGKVRVARAPFTYWNRLLLKRSLRKAFAAGACRERTFLAPSGEGRARFPKPLAVLEAVLAAIVAVF